MSKTTGTILAIAGSVLIFVPLLLGAFVQGMFAIVNLTAGNESLQIYPLNVVQMTVDGTTEVLQGSETIIVMAFCFALILFGGLMLMGGIMGSRKATLLGSILALLALLACFAFFYFILAQLTLAGGPAFNISVLFASLGFTLPFLGSIIGTIGGAMIKE